MTYVMSDIHGDLDRFRSVMDQIHLKADDHLYCPTVESSYSDTHQPSLIKIKSLSQFITGKEKSESTAEAEIHMKHADSLAFD